VKSAAGAGYHCRQQSESSRMSSAAIVGTAVVKKCCLGRHHIPRYHLFRDCLLENDLLLDGSRCKHSRKVVDVVSMLR